MSVLREYIHNILNEGIVDDLKKKYPYYEPDINKLSDNDPSGHNKYLLWGLKQLRFSFGEVPNIVKAMKIFHSNMHAFPSKDINSYTVEELLELISKTDLTSNVQKKRTSKNEGAIKIYDDTSFTMFRIDTRPASIEYGKGTKWCISMMNKDTYWIDHIKVSVFYFLIDKETKQKFAIDYQHLVGSINVYDENDDLHDDLYSAYSNSIYESMTDLDEIRAKLGKVENLQYRIYSLIKNDAKNSPLFRLSKFQMSSDEFYEFALKDPLAITCLWFVDEKAPIEKYRPAIEKLLNHESTRMYAEDVLH